MNESVRDQTAAIASGDTEAFARFFRGRFDGMYADARRATGRDESFCLDVVQDAMVRVIRSIKPIETERHLRNWLRTVVQSCAYDRLRQEQRQRRVEQAAAGETLGTANNEDLHERLAWLRRELATVEASRAGLLTLRYRLGWTLQRIGDALGMTSGTVDGRVTRTVADLRQRARETYHD